MKVVFKIFVFLFLLFQLIPAQNLPSTEGLKEINGTKLFVKTMGSGEPIVIVHGGPGWNHQYLLPSFKVLAKHYKLIFYDQRASGMSSADVDTSTINMKNFVEDLEGIRNFFGIKKMNLLGHSWGGLIAMYYAIKYPQNLKSLILSNSTPPTSDLRNKSYYIMSSRGTKKEKQEARKISSSQAFKDRNPMAVGNFYRILFSSSIYNKPYVDSLNFHLPDDFPEKSELLKFIYRDKSVSDYNIKPKIEMINCPTLIITGDYDLMPQESNKDIHKAIKNSKLVTLKHCGHFPFIEDKKEYFTLLENFLSGVNKKK